MILEKFSLDGECALITGGGTGLGFAIAEAFVDAGARVIICGRRQRVLDEAVDRLGQNAFGERFDITETAKTKAFVERLHEAYGPITILVNNAGIHLKKPAEEVTEEEFHQLFDTHVLGAHALTRRLLPSMKSRGHGVILFMSSMAALFGLPNVVAYGGVKSAYLGIVRTLAVELGSSGVRVNAIAPGFIETPMLHEALDPDPARREKILSRTPMNKFGQPEDVAYAALYLASPAGKFVTGICLPVDGGAAIGF